MIVMFSTRGQMVNDLSPESKDALRSILSYGLRIGLEGDILTTFSLFLVQRHGPEFTDAARLELERFAQEWNSL